MKNMQCNKCSSNKLRPDPAMSYCDAIDSDGRSYYCADFGNHANTEEKLIEALTQIIIPHTNTTAVSSMAIAIDILKNFIVYKKP